MIRAVASSTKNLVCSTRVLWVNGHQVGLDWHDVQTMPGKASVFLLRPPEIERAASVTFGDNFRLPLRIAIHVARANIQVAGALGYSGDTLSSRGIERAHCAQQFTAKRQWLRLRLAHVDDRASGRAGSHSLRRPRQLAHAPEKSWGQGVVRVRSLEAADLPGYKDAIRAQLPELLQRHLHSARTQLLHYTGPYEPPPWAHIDGNGMTSLELVTGSKTTALHLGAKRSNADFELVAAPIFAPARGTLFITGSELAALPGFQATPHASRAVLPGEPTRVVAQTHLRFDIEALARELGASSFERRRGVRR